MGSPHCCEQLWRCPHVLNSWRSLPGLVPLGVWPYTTVLLQACHSNALRQASSLLSDQPAPVRWHVPHGGHAERAWLQEA